MNTIDKTPEIVDASCLFAIQPTNEGSSKHFQFAALSEILSVINPQLARAHLGGANDADFMPSSDPESDFTQYTVPFGDFTPDNDYGVPSDVDKAMKQLLDIQKWIYDVGINPDIVPHLFYAMLGFEKRLDTTWAGSSDPTISAIKNGLANLASMKVDGNSLGNRMVFWAMNMELYSPPQDPSGNPVIAMLASMRAAIGSNPNNPILSIMSTSIDYYLNPNGTATQPFTDWLNSHLSPDKTRVVDDAGNSISYKDWCNAYGQNIYNFFSKSPINNNWQSSLMDWFRQLIEKFMASLGACNALPIVLYILGEMSDSFQNDSGGLSFIAKALQSTISTFAKAVSDGSTQNITPNAVKELVESLRSTATKIAQDPRLAEASGAISTATSLLSIKGAGYISAGATIEDDIMAYNDPSSKFYQDPKVLNDAAAGWNANASQPGQLQTISTELQAASSNLTNISQNTGPKIQTKQQMVSQTTDLMNTSVTKWTEMISSAIKGQITT